MEARGMLRNLYFLTLISTFIIGISSGHALADKEQGHDLKSAIERIIALDPMVKDKNCASPQIPICEEKSQDSEEKIAGRGCCSWHSGVCGCSPSGRAVCCDGQLSPSCGC